MRLNIRCTHSVPIRRLIIVGLHAFWNRVHNDPSRSSKVVDFGTTRKHARDFLFVLSSNLGPILLRFRDIKVFCADSHFCPYLTPISAKILGVLLEYIHGIWVYREWTPSANQPKFQCDHDTSTSRTDGQVDNLPLQYRAVRSITR